MSSLYEINEQLLNLTDSETGEIEDWTAYGYCDDCKITVDIDTHEHEEN